MSFNPKYSITPKVNKALVEIERVRGFLDAIKLKDDWVSDMQKKALLLESHHSTHIEGTAINLEQAQDILSGKKVTGMSRHDEEDRNCRKSRRLGLTTVRRKRLNLSRKMTRYCDITATFPVTKLMNVSLSG